ncbi:MAG: transporter family protein [Firmicutes bacterium]|nr:transporter family protein [Bacillota bacterium]
MSKYLVAFFSIALTAVAQILLKLGVVASASTTLAPVHVRLLRTVINPFVLAGLAVYGLSTLCWLIALSKLRLSVAYPMVSFSYVLVTVASAIIFREAITRNQILGLCLIITGVVFLVR